MCYVLCVMCYVLCVMCYVLCVMCYVLCVMCYVLCVMCYVLCVMCYVLCVMCYVLCVMCYVLCVMCYVLCAERVWQVITSDCPLTTCTCGGSCFTKSGVMARRTGGDELAVCAGPRRRSKMSISHSLHGSRWDVGPQFPWVRHG